MQALAFFGSLGLLAIGLWMERPSLALIIPGAVGATLIVVKRWSERPRKKE